MCVCVCLTAAVKEEEGWSMNVRLLKEGGGERERERGLETLYFYKFLHS